MSLVMAVGSKEYILFASERRKTTTNIVTKEVEIEENFEKTHRINRNVLIGYAGDAAYCKTITENLTNGQMNLREKHNLSYRDVDNFIEARFKSVIGQVEADLEKYRKAKAYIVVGGVENGILNLSSYFYENELKVNKFKLESLTPKLITLSSGQYNHEGYFSNEFSKVPISKIENIKGIFKKTLNNGVRFDTSINNNVDFKQIIL